MTDTTRLDEIRAREQAATPGPWGTSRDLNGTYTIKHGTRITREDGFGSDGDVAVLVGDEQAAFSNGSFIARARKDVPYLLNRVAELEAAVQRACGLATRLEEFAENALRVDDRELYTAIAKDLRDRLNAVGVQQPTATAAPEQRQHG
ncbi:hypothetical protein AB0L71_28330 [Streptomyces sp. NPDC052052]|uniref:hypothetical protein n=1 Tax=Streptomyces sp. NPDC052052 TaxID=3154756 RepID=UPI00342B9D3A